MTLRVMLFEFFPTFPLMLKLAISANMQFWKKFILFQQERIFTCNFADFLVQKAVHKKAHSRPVCFLKFLWKRSLKYLQRSLKTYFYIRNFLIQLHRKIIS